MSVIREIGDFFTIDYSTIFNKDTYPDDPLSGSFYSLFTPPLVPILSVVLYLLLSDPVFIFLRNNFAIEPKGWAMQTLTITHSGLLALYSIWTFLNSFSIVFPYIMEHGLVATMCDVDGVLWNDHNIGWWMTHFYISKYYEFLDTWIVILKGRVPMLLQVYHHAGVVILMWAMVTTRCIPGGGYILVVNSFIHSLMYSYYVLATFGYSSPLKAYLTQAQIFQFISGLCVTFYLHFVEGCQNAAQTLSLIMLQVYTVILTGLFAQFYVRSYSQKKK